MSRWKYKLGITGKVLRDTIKNGGTDNESCINTMDKLLACYRKLHEILPVEEMEYFFEEGFEDAQSMLEDLKSRTLPKSVRLAATNDALGDFYDACDSCGVWIEI